LRGIDREYADDPQARQRARSEFYKANHVSPFAGFGWLVADLVFSRVVLFLPSGGGQTVRDRITGTIVIVDR